MISYVLPFFKKAKHFRLVLPVNDCFHTPNAEVICVLDDPSDETEVLQIVRANPAVKFRVIVNDWPHLWRPPCIAFNVGIRHATHHHVVLASPESVIDLPHPQFLEQLVDKDFRLCYAGVCWLEDDIKIGDSPGLVRHKIQVSEAIGHVFKAGYGFLLAPRLALERIHGFDESRTVYGNDDDDIRIRLIRLGYRCLIDGRIKIFHTFHEGVVRVADHYEPMRKEIAIADQAETFGRAFNRVAWDWTKSV